MWVLGGNYVVTSLKLTCNKLTKAKEKVLTINISLSEDGKMVRGRKWRGLEMRKDQSIRISCHLLAFLKQNCKYNHVTNIIIKIENKLIYGEISSNFVLGVKIVSF